MDAGLARELASPKALLEDPDSMFAKLVQEYMGQPTLYATTQERMKHTSSPRAPTQQ